jgi:hypothetical protein
MSAMPLSQSSVAAASAAWVWIPDNATVVDDAGYCLTHGASMALVKGKIDTSGPILRRAGFTAFGQEPNYDVPHLSGDCEGGRVSRTRSG